MNEIIKEGLVAFTKTFGLGILGLTVEGVIFYAIGKHKEKKYGRVITIANDI